MHDTLGGSGREYITVLGCGSVVVQVCGVRLPPYVVYKGKKLWSRWMCNGPAGTLYSVSDSGWMEASNFKKMLIPAVQYLTERLPIILFFHSHICIALIELACASNIHLSCFPPCFTTIGGFSFQSHEKEYQIASCAALVTKEEFPAKHWDISFLPQHLKIGFTKCGLCPLSRATISPEKLVKSAPHEKLTKSQQP